MLRRVHIVATLCALVAATVLAAAQSPTQDDADRMEQKMLAVTQRGEAKPGARPSAPVRTSFTEREVNAYLKFKIREQLPPGVLDPQVMIAGDQRLTCHAIVDLDAVRKSKERTWLDPGSYLSGSVEVKITAVLQTSNGKGTFQLESATVGTLPIPKSLLQELVTYYSHSADMPTGFDLDKPFDLPANIRDVELQRGTAIVIQ